MKIGEIAKQAGVTVDTVRFYERVGVLPTPERTESGYRDYEPATVVRIQLTRELQAIGFTLADAVDALAAHDGGGATCDLLSLDLPRAGAAGGRLPSPPALGASPRTPRALGDETRLAIALALR